MTPAKMALWDRLSQALGGHDVRPDVRQQILDETGEADSWEQVPDDVKQLIVKIENSAPQTWPDPADLPDQQGL